MYLYDKCIYGVFIFIKILESDLLMIINQFIFFPLQFYPYKLRLKVQSKMFFILFLFIKLLKLN